MDIRRANPRIVLIGIQARSNSERLPNKIMRVIRGRKLLDRVVSACTSSSDHLNRNFGKFQLNVRAAVLIPFGDPVEHDYRNSKIQMMSFEGLREEDVLSRYYKAAKEMRADFIVRVTADCAQLQDFLISGMVTAASFGNYDYVTNTHHRTFREGWDVEVISSDLLEWLNSAAVTAEQREHVTMLLRFRDKVPKSFKYRHYFARVDDSDKKTSIDDMEDVLRLEAEEESIQSKKNAALMNGDAVE